MLAGIEAGGTKCVLTLAHSPTEVVETRRIPTRTPELALPEIGAILTEWQALHGEIKALCIGAFGPVNVNPESPDYGLILDSPKVAWRGINWIDALRPFCSGEISVITDVMAAAWAESRLGAGANANSLAYITVGTGIGGAAVMDSRLLTGAPHAEFGHMFIGKEADDADFAGICPSHGNCWEGLACGPAIQARWGVPAETLPADHPAWDLEARYLARGIVNLIATLAPEMVILGGGVSFAPGLVERIRQHVTRISAGYFALPRWGDEIDQNLVLAALGGNAGGIGTLMLAQDSISRTTLLPI